MSAQITIVCLYVIITIAIGLVISRRAGSGAVFHGSALGITAIVCAAAGEWLGGTATSGVAEYGFIYGISGMWYTLANALGVLLLAFGFAKIYRRMERVTVPGIIQRLYGVKARVLSSVLLCAVMLAVGISQMIAAGKLGQSLLGIPFPRAAALFAAVVVAYTARGGMRAVSATNMLHLFVMYFGVIAAVVLGIRNLGGGDAFSMEIEELRLRTGTNLVGAFSIGGAKVISWIAASMLGACTAQAGIQPVLAAKDEKSAKTASILTACVVAPFGVFTTLLGMISRVMSENGTLLTAGGAVVTEAKLALPALMLSLPPAVGGLVLAAILAAVFSTAAPIFLAVGTMVSRDIASLWVRDERRLGRINRITVAVSAVFCTLGAVFLADMGQILDIVYGAYSLRGAIFIVILYGLFWKKASQRAACASMALTAAVAAFWIGTKYLTGSYPLANWFSETYAAVLTAAVSLPLSSAVWKKTEII